MDFIKHFLVFDRYTDILVVMDWLTKQAIFILTHDILNANGLAVFFITHIFFKYSIPLHIIFDYSFEFVSKFFQLLAIVLDMKLYFTLEYYPEADR